MSVTGSGPVTGHWFQVWPDDPREHTLIDIVLSAGTATWVIEGRNGPLDAAVQIATGSATASTVANRFSQIRIRLSAAAAATLLATIDRPAKDTGA